MGREVGESCELCGRELDDDSLYCYGCGASLCTHCYEQGGWIHGRHEQEDHLFDSEERDALLSWK